MRRFLVLIISISMVALTAAPALTVPAQGDDRWALLIGIDDYQGTTRSNVGAVGDVNSFKTLLVQKGWREDRIRVLTDSAATQAGIRQGLQWMVDNCGPSSYCVVHYSGHTKQMNNVGGSEGLHEYLWPNDNQFISDDEFSDYMRRLRGYVWIDIAACEAAGFDNGASSSRRLFTAASQESEKGYEDPSWATSVWTGLLVNRAILGGEADTNGDGAVTLNEAFPWAAERAARETASQSFGPQRPYRAGGEETEFFGPGTSAAAASAAPPAKGCILMILCL